MNDKKDIIVGSSEKLIIPVEKLLEPGCVIELHATDRPTMRNVLDEELEELSYSAKAVADEYYELVTNNCDWEAFAHNSRTKLESYIALAGLSCEIYLKALLFQYKGVKASERKIHDLKELFEKLQECQPDIASRIIESVSGDECDSFRFELDISKNLFNDFRYGYELNGYEINISFIQRLLNSLKQITQDALK